MVHTLAEVGSGSRPDGRVGRVIRQDCKDKADVAHVQCSHLNEARGYRLLHDGVTVVTFFFEVVLSDVFGVLHVAILGVAFKDFLHLSCLPVSLVSLASLASLALLAAVVAVASLGSLFSLSSLASRVLPPLPLLIRCDGHEENVHLIINFTLFSLLHINFHSLALRFKLHSYMLPSSNASRPIQACFKLYASHSILHALRDLRSRFCDPRRIFCDIHSTLHL
jgi:hypothetical protein